MAAVKKIEKGLDQGTLIEIAIKKAGSVNELAKIFDIRRETLWRWRESLSEMKYLQYRKFQRWLEQNE